MALFHYGNRAIPQFYSVADYRSSISHGMQSRLAMLIGEITEAHPSIAFLLRLWRTPTVLDLGIMSGLGLVWASGIYLIARAYSTAQASVIALFEYTNLLINVMWDFLLWSVFPTPITWTGALITVGCGL